ncbi:MAG: gephyrin-like molybdotransferase Glp [Gemmatimonadota bacterium]
MGDADWLTYESALEAILSTVGPSGVERVPAADALGRALAERVVARVDHPPWDNSAMDGFAVHADDVAGASPAAPVILPISDDIAAGRFPAGPLRRGTAARVMTGAPVPDGATGVVRVEHTDGGSRGQVRILDDADASRHIRPKAEDIASGDTLLSGGSAITPAAVALLAMTGRDDVRVGRRPRIGILANGDELAAAHEFDEVLAGRRIANSNGPGLAAQVIEAGGEPVLLGIARDDPESLRRRIESGAECDGIISAAGVSVGEHDYVKSVLDDLGFDRSFWRVKMRPGSATLFGLLDGRPFWGVPGNPVSAMVTFEALARPAIRRMAGFQATRRVTIPCRVAEDVRGPADVVSFLRVVLVDDSPPVLSVRLSGPQGSGVLSSMIADGLLILPEGMSGVERGGMAEMLPLRELFRPEASA